MADNPKLSAIVFCDKNRRLNWPTFVAKLNKCKLKAS